MEANSSRFTLVRQLISHLDTVDANSKAPIAHSVILDTIPGCEALYLRLDRDKDTIAWLSYNNNATTASLRMQMLHVEDTSKEPGSSDSFVILLCCLWNVARVRLIMGVSVAHIFCASTCWNENQIFRFASTCHQRQRSCCQGTTTK